MDNKGDLYIVSTPIGNLDDMSLRAIETLKYVELIAAEDTRHSKKLLNHYNITTALMPYHDHNEVVQADKIIKKLLAGKSIALISDAGTPLISDPGHALIQAAIIAEIKVIPIPGPCAATTALAAAGLPCDQYSFVGFLPVKAGMRSAKINEVLVNTETSVLYEAPHRLMSLLTELSELMPERIICVAKELTKRHERFIRGNALSLVEYFQEHEETLRGEFVVLISAAEKKQAMSFDDVLNVLLSDLPLKQAVKLTAKITGASKNEIYQRALVLKNE